MGGAVLGLIGVAVGALLTAWFSSRSAAGQRRREAIKALAMVSQELFQIRGILTDAVANKRWWNGRLPHTAWDEVGAATAVPLGPKNFRDLAGFYERARRAQTRQVQALKSATEQLTERRSGQTLSGLEPASDLALVANIVMPAEEIEITNDIAAEAQRLDGKVSASLDVRQTERESSKRFRKRTWLSALVVAVIAVLALFAWLLVPAPERSTAAIEFAIEHQLGYSAECHPAGGDGTSWLCQLYVSVPQAECQAAQALPQALAGSMGYTRATPSVGPLDEVDGPAPAETLVTAVVVAQGAPLVVGPAASRSGDLMAAARRMPAHPVRSSQVRSECLKRYGAPATVGDDDAGNDTMRATIPFPPAERSKVQPQTGSKKKVEKSIVQLPTGERDIVMTFDEPEERPVESWWDRWWPF